jgi:hypothetical protein
MKLLIHSFFRLSIILSLLDPNILFITVFSITACAPPLIEFKVYTRANIKRSIFCFLYTSKFDVGRVILGKIDKFDLSSM